MNQTAMARIAAAISHLRPEWPQSSVLTTITKHLADRAYRDVAVALTWVAADETSKTPARVLENGPWWVAANAGGADTPGTPTAPAMQTLRCGSCGFLRVRGEIHTCGAVADPHEGRALAQAQLDAARLQITEEARQRIDAKQQAAIDEANAATQGDD